MSVRAYRVNTIEVEDNASFNLWHDIDLLNFFENRDDFYNALNHDGNGNIEMSVISLEKAVETLTLEDYTKEAILKDIAWAKEQKAEYIMYSCG